MAKQIFEVMGKDELKKEIVQIGKAGARLNTRIQSAALNAIYYSIAEGYIHYGNMLYLSMNAGQRRNSLVAFLEKHGKFEWSKEQKEFIFKKRDDVTADSVKEITEQWHDAIKEPVIKSMYDFDADAVKFIKRMEKAIMDKATIKNIELFDYISAAVNQYHADQVQDDDVNEVEFTDENLEEMQALMQEVVESSREPMRRAA